MRADLIERLIAEARAEDKTFHHSYVVDDIRKENARLKRMVKEAGDRLRAAGKQPWQFGILGP